jgi:hypothetical protein
VSQRRLMTAVEDFINEGAAPAERMIRDSVACELAYINTDHPNFIGGNRAIAQVDTLPARLSDSRSDGAAGDVTDWKIHPELPACLHIAFRAAHLWCLLLCVFS